MCHCPNWRRTVRAYRRKLLSRSHTVWLDLSLDAPPPVPRPRFEARLLLDAPERVLRFIQSLDVPGSCDPIEIARMRERRQLFAGLLEGDTLVGFAKVGWGRVYLLDYRIDVDLPPDACFVLETWILPERRGLGAGSFVVAALATEMHRRGFRRRISEVKLDNHVMRSTLGAFHARELGRVDGLTLLGRQFLRPHPVELLRAPFQLRIQPASLPDSHQAVEPVDAIPPSTRGPGTPGRPRPPAGANPAAPREEHRTPGPSPVGAA